MQTFGKWLTNLECSRDDALGQLILDAKCDHWFPLTSKHRDTYRDYLWEREATAQVKAAFDRAWEIWLSEREEAG
jgi:uncharacterized protein YozE (UPF0346 family)